MRHYQRLGGAVETAQANATQDALNVNALQQLFNQSSQSTPPPSSPTSGVQSWLRSHGIDSTGHTQNNPLENYITGDDSP